MKPQLVHHDVHMMRRKHAQGLKNEAFGQHAKSKNLLNLFSVQNSAHNSSYCSNFNECGDAPSFLQNSSLILTSTLEKPCFVVQPSHTPRNPYLRLRTPIDSKLKYRVVHFDLSPGTHFFLTFDIQVENTVSLLSQLTARETLSDKHCNQLSTYLTLNTIAQDIVFRCEAESLSLDLFDVQVTCHSKKSLQIMTLEGLTKCHWDRLSQVVTASKYWTSLLKIDSVFSESDDDGSVYERVFISATPDHCAEQVTMGIESLQAVQDLCVEDQLIVVKEGYFTVGLFLYMNTFIRKDNCFALSSYVSRDLFALDVHLESNKTKYSNHLYETFVKFLSKLPNFLTEDFIFMAIVGILHLFQDDSALSSSCNFKKERCLFFELLDKYINAKIASGQWNTNNSSIWENIERIAECVKEVKSSLVTLQRSVHNTK